MYEHPALFEQETPFFPQGFITYLMTAPEEIRGTGYMWRALENNLPGVKEEVELMRPCNDRKV